MEEDRILFDAADINKVPNIFCSIKDFNWMYQRAVFPNN